VLILLPPTLPSNPLSRALSLLLGLVLVLSSLSRAFPRCPPNPFQVNKNSEAFRFNQLKARVKQLSFRKSGIHGWGLYAEQVAPSVAVFPHVGYCKLHSYCRSVRNTSSLGSSTSSL